MSDHKSALVPLEAWCYASPELRSDGRSIDIGLFAEALIYYDCVLVNPGNQPQFAEFLRWFADHGHWADLLELIRDGTIKIYDYAFITAPIEHQGSYSIWNVQDPIQSRPNTFEQRFLYHKSVEGVLPLKARHRTRFYEAFRGRVIEAKADEFGKSVENARDDFNNPKRNALIVQAFLNELYRFKRLGEPPEVTARVATSSGGQKHRVTWNVNFSEIATLAGSELSFHRGTPLAGGAHSNRLIWSAAALGCDLYLPRPMSRLVGDKLYEATERVAKAGCVIESLKGTVEFPDVRLLVNTDQLGLSEVLAIRKKARRFRDWLQAEADRDRDAIIAYHNEVARDSGFTKGARMALQLFGVVGGGALGALVGGLQAGALGGAIGAGAGHAISYLADVASKVGADWKPVVFGDWLRDRIERVVREDGD